jgi:hypothetical protein
LHQDAQQGRVFAQFSEVSCPGSAKLFVREIGGQERGGLGRKQVGAALQKLGEHGPLDERNLFGIVERFQCIHSFWLPD